MKFSERNENRMRELVELRAIRDALARENTTLRNKASEASKECERLRAVLAEAKAKAIEECAQRALKARHESGANVALFAHGWDAGCAWCFNAIRSLSPTTPAH